MYLFKLNIILILIISSFWKLSYCYSLSDYFHLSLGNESINLNSENEVGNQSEFRNEHDFVYVNDKDGKCLQNVHQVTKLINDFLDDPTKSPQWLLHFIDSFSKIPSAILEGNTNWIGNFRQCNEVNATDLGFGGKYCTVSWSVVVHNNTKSFQSGICMPNSCSGYQDNATIAFLQGILDDIPYLNKFKKTILPKIYSIKCLEDAKIETDGIMLIAVFVIFLTITIVATLIDLFQHQVKVRNNSKFSNGVTSPVALNNADNIEEDENSRVGENAGDTSPILQNEDPAHTNELLHKTLDFLSCFSLYYNFPKLFSVKAPAGNQKRKELTCLHGIRALSMFWIVYIHTYSYNSPSFRDPEVVPKEYGSLLFFTIANSTYSVDTFFVMSGFLLCYTYLSKEGTPQKNKWFRYYVHRYLRLTPIFAIVLWFNASLGHVVGNGPLWDYGDTSYSQKQICAQTWWKSLLYIINFGDFHTWCISWSWYLSNDMQFYVISPIFLILLSRRPKIGVVVTVLTLLASWIITFFVGYIGKYGIADFAPTLDKDFTNESLIGYFNYLYVRPYCRIGPYLIGILTGYLYLNHYDKLAQIKGKYYIAGSVTATILALTAVYSIYNAKLTDFEAGIYNALSRSAWGIAIAWVLIICLTGQSPFVDKILSLPCWVPFSRLTYSVYLTHVLLVLLYFTNIKDTFYFSHSQYWTYATAFLIYAYLISVVLTLLFEIPLLELEKRILHRKKSK